MNFFSTSIELTFGNVVAVNVFLTTVAMEKVIPFELKLPIKENVKNYSNSKELFKGLGI